MLSLFHQRHRQFFRFHTPYIFHKVTPELDSPQIPARFAKIWRSKEKGRCPMGHQPAISCYILADGAGLPPQRRRLVAPLAPVCHTSGAGLFLSHRPAPHFGHTRILPAPVCQTNGAGLPTPSKKTLSLNREHRTPSLRAFSAPGGAHPLSGQFPAPAPPLVHAFLLPQLD